jgi:uncharacterized cupredoxin-like copper-binding protein
MKRIAALGAVVVLVAAACGTDESGAIPDPSTTEAPATTEPAAPTTAPTETTAPQTQASEPAQADTGTPGADMATDDVEHGTDHGDDQSITAEGAESQAADRTIEVTMTELVFDPDEFAVTAGETIRFDVTNAGQIVHEFRLSNAHRVEEHLASGHEGHGDDTGGHHGDVDVVLELDPGESGQVIVTFPEDTTLFTEIACLIPGHYEAGMKAPLAYA